MKFTKSNEELALLQQTFSKLTSVDDKFTFWEKELGHHYSYWPMLDSKLINAFEINSNEESEIEYINELNIAFIKSHRKIRGHAYFDLEAEKRNFDKKLYATNDKQAFRETELTTIQKFIRRKEDANDLFEMERNEYFLLGYQNYLNNRLEPDAKGRVYNPHFLYEKVCGYEYAKYHLHVTGDDKKHKISMKYDHSTQLLLLHYLGIGHKQDDKQKSILYGSITNRDIESTHLLLPKLNSLKTKKRLTTVHEILLLSNMKDAAKKVLKDIDKL